MEIKQTIERLVERSREAIPIEAGDYTDRSGLLICGQCGTPKQVEIELSGVKHRPFCLCKCASERRDAEESRLKEIQRRNRLDNLRRAAFPPEERELMQTWTFANDDGGNPKLTEAMRRYVENFPKMLESGKGLLLWGDRGRGKTFAACQAANALLDGGISVLVTSFTRILNILQNAFSRQEYIDGLNRFSLLVIDDLGVERETAYAKEQVYNVIDSRYRAGLPMIITTNLSIDKLKRPDDIDSGRIYDRILERAFPVEVTGSNRRHKIIREEYDSMKELLGL